MQYQLRVGIVWIFIEVIDSCSVEKRGTSLDPVYFIPLGEEKLGKIRAVLTSYTRDQSLLRLQIAGLHVGHI